MKDNHLRWEIFSQHASPLHLSDSPLPLNSFCKPVFILISHTNIAYRQVWHVSVGSVYTETRQLRTITLGQTN